MITMMVRWTVTADEKRRQFIEELRAVPLKDRINDDRVINTVKNLKETWMKGNRIEKLAILGWDDKEAVQTFCNILEQMDHIKQQYDEEVKQHGVPPELRDEDAEKYEKYSNEMRKNFRPPKLN